MDTNVYEKLNEGLGGAYERIAYSNIIKRIAASRGCKNILELNATYIAGIPGFNSCLLSQDGLDVTVTVHSRDYEDTKHVWELTELPVLLVELSNDLRTPFADNEFDFVWNHLAFEHYEHPELLVREMKRISCGVVMNLTLTPWNIGCIIHWLNHKWQKKPWDHGSLRQSTIGAMERVHKAEGLSHLESGACDMPPWMDTVDAQMAGSMTYMDNIPILRNNWVWCSVNPECQEHRYVKTFWKWEQNAPEWFRRLVAHHLYVVSVKQ